MEDSMLNDVLFIEMPQIPAGNIEFSLGLPLEKRDTC